MLFYDLRDKIKRYFAFSPEEIRGLIITILAIAFMFSFRDWGEKEFNFIVGIRNLFDAVLIVGLSLLVHESTHRIAGLQIGFRVEYQAWFVGLIIGVILTFITQGVFWFFIAPGGILLHHLAQHRLGYFRYGINMWAQAGICFWGILVTLLLASFFKAMLLLMPNNVLLYKAMVFNIVLAIFSLLPIPPLDGSRIMFGSTGLWIITIIITVLFSAMLLLTKVNVLWWLSAGIIFLLMLLYAYHILYERLGVGKLG